MSQILISKDPVAVKVAPTRKKATAATDPKKRVSLQSPELRTMLPKM